MWASLHRSVAQGASTLPPDRTETNAGRVVPVGSRLRAVLDLRRHAPDGEPHPPTAYIFGNEAATSSPFPRAAQRWAALGVYGERSAFFAHHSHKEGRTRKRPDWGPAVTY